MSILGVLLVLVLALGLAQLVRMGYWLARAIRQRRRARLNAARSRDMRLAFEGMTAGLAARAAGECPMPADT